MQRHHPNQIMSTVENGTSSIISSPLSALTYSQTLHNLSYIRISNDSRHRRANEAIYPVNIRWVSASAEN